MSLHTQLNHLASSFAQAVFQAIRNVSLEELVAETGGLKGMDRSAPRPALIGRSSERELVQMTERSRAQSPGSWQGRERGGPRGSRRVAHRRASPGRRRGRRRRTARGRRASSRRLKRRSPDDIQKALGDVVSLVENRPKGPRAEQIRSELGMQAKEMPRVLGEGLASRKLRKRGHKRATTYYAT